MCGEEILEYNGIRQGVIEMLQETHIAGIIEFF